MAKSLFWKTLATAVNFGTTQYGLLSTGGYTTTDDGRSKTKFRQGGVMSALWVYVSVNGLNSGNSTIKLRVNGTVTALAVTIPFGVTGYFIDNTNTVTIAAGDEVDYEFITSGTSGTLLPFSVSLTFTPTVHHYKYTTGLATGTSIAALATSYVCVGGSTAVAATELNAQWKSRMAGTWKNLQINISFNDSTATMEVRSRINGASGNQLISVATTVIGILDDVTNTDTVADGDLINYLITSGAGVGTVTFMSLSSDLNNTTNKFEVLSWAAATVNYTFNITRDLFWHGSLSATSFAEAAMQKYTSFSFRGSNLRLFISANTNATGATYLLRKNGANANQTIAIGASGTGWFEDTTNTDLIRAGDLFNPRITTAGAAGNVTVKSHGMTCQVLRVYDFAPFF